MPPLKGEVAKPEGSFCGLLTSHRLRAELPFQGSQGSRGSYSYQKIFIDIVCLHLLSELSIIETKEREHYGKHKRGFRKN